MVNLGGIAISRVGSRVAMLTMTAGAIAGAIVLSTMTITPAASLGVILVMLTFTGGLINAVQTTMYALATHVYPSAIRATGVGTAIAEGKETKVFNGRTYVMETGLFADIALVHAWKADPEGNLVYNKTARNFNPVMATAAKVTIAEVEELVPMGALDPDHIVTPGIFVKRIVKLDHVDKRIEQRTVRKRQAA